MQLNLLTGLLATLAISPAAASPLEARNWPASVTQRFYLKGNATGSNRIDGIYVGTRPYANTYVGFGLPYGQVVTDFGYDPTSGLVYTACTATGQPLILSAFPTGATAAALKPALKGQAGATPVKCTVLAETLLCGAIINGVNFNKPIVVDYNEDGYFEVALSTIFGFSVQLVTEKND